MKKLLTICAVVLMAAVGQAGAALTGYVSNPQTNSVDWTNAVTAAGGTITNLNFNDISTGVLTLVSTGNYALNAYQASEGVTFAVKGNAPAITYGVGPGDSGSYQLNPGEGLHPTSNYLSFPPYPGYSGGYVTSIIMNFTEAVSSVGFYTIGLNNSFTPGITRITIEAFTGINATGTSLGTFTSLDAHNFNPNNLYFMGLTSNINEIMSFRIGGSWQKAFGDKLGFDDFRFATVPEPATIALLSIGVLSMLRRKNH
ncbi:MAG: PEP-CTERM sorting domain-containing protein [Phycisphaerae bacterium]|jgi:hypothetical protein